MNLEKVRDIARTVLYEGFILYPYRPSSIKNRQRWTFGGLFPEVYTRRGGGDAFRQQVQCLAQGGGDAELQVQLHCLQLVDRQVARLSPPVSALPGGGELPPHVPVTELEVAGRRYCSWQEAVEREVAAPRASLHDLCRAPLCVPFELSAQRTLEPVAAGERIEAVLVRDRRAVGGRLTVGAEHAGPGLFRITATAENVTPLPEPVPRRRDAAALYSLASTHMVLGVTGGDFISLIDPPGPLADAAAGCQNDGAFPVLVGAPGERDTLLAAPIILYDYPVVAPESPGDLFDATEIDEILSLRILTMTPAEKREMAAADPRAAELLSRTETLSADAMQRLHGALRALRPVSAALHRFGVGDRVRLHPRPGGDIMDLALAGRTAVVQAVETDLESRVHVAVTVDADPGRDFGTESLPGHRFFFSPEELEPAGGAAGGAG